MAQIRDAAAARGIDRTAYLLAGIAQAETGLAHCWSEAQWACQGPASPDCGGGPVIAGAGDGPCANLQGGLGMFQFDGGTHQQTLARDGEGILTVAGNVDRAITFVVDMVRRSAYTRGAGDNELALRWIANFDPNDAGLRDAWIRTVTHYYNGCRPDFGCWNQRYAHYSDSLQHVVDETGYDFWVAGPRDALPVGHLDAADCAGARGWAHDLDGPQAALDVHVYFGGPAGPDARGVSVRADVHRDDLCEAIDSCAHGFSLPTPLSLHDGQPHPVHAYGIGFDGGGNAELADSPRQLQCPPTVPDGVRRHVVDEDSYAAWRLDAWWDRLPAPQEAVEERTEGIPMPASPRLIRAEGDPGVFVVDGAYRRHVTLAGMQGWRFDWDAIEDVPLEDRDVYSAGPPWRERPTEVVGADGRVWIIDEPLPVIEEEAGPDAGGTPPWAMSDGAVDAPPAEDGGADAAVGRPDAAPRPPPADGSEAGPPVEEWGDTDVDGPSPGTRLTGEGGCTVGPSGPPQDRPIVVALLLLGALRRRRGRATGAPSPTP